MDGDTLIRARVLEHWEASEQGDIATEHAVYAEDAVLDYPQSGERFRGRATIAAQRGGHPANRHFTVQRISGAGDLWVSECVISYDGAPTHSVSIMEFSGGFVVHETQYFADPFVPPRSRAGLAESMPER
jgi:ketosteroid isomerase-like protein